MRRLRTTLHPPAHRHRRARRGARDHRRHRAGRARRRRPEAGPEAAGPAPSTTRSPPSRSPASPRGSSSPTACSPPARSPAARPPRWPPAPRGACGLTGDGRLRLELQSEAGDAQIVIGKDRFSIYDASSNTAYVGALPERRAEAAEHEPPTLGEGPRRARPPGAELEALRRRADLDRRAARPTPSASLPRTTAGCSARPSSHGTPSHGVPLRAAVYAQGQEEPVLELKATDISYGAVAGRRACRPIRRRARPSSTSRRRATTPRAARPRCAARRRSRRGWTSRSRRPKTLAGLPRKQVRLADFGGEPAALVTYGEGLGGIVVLERKAPRPRPTRARRVRRCRRSTSTARRARSSRPRSARW